MSLKIMLITAGIGIVTSAITAYLTTRLKMREERDKWRREFAFKFAEKQITDNVAAQKMAAQFAIGVIIKNPETPEREKIFVPPNCRLIVGRAPDNAIVLDDPRVSRHHFAFFADDTNVFVEELGRSANITFINGERINGRLKLKSNDVITTGQTELRFHKLDVY
jgi:pSer/pThr/pTyr-binding forkhead associated (FHA) protein